MKSWFITGASKGLGRAFTLAALERGDRVGAAARDIEPLGPLVERFGDAILPLRLDVTDRAAVAAAVQRCQKTFGGLDVVVNNAGRGGIGSVEETTEYEARAIMEANFFGPLWVTQAVLPLLREQGRGHIVQVSSVAGLVAFPMVGFYNASKWALEGLSEALAQEVAEFGIRVTLIEPGAMRTEWAKASMPLATDPLEAYSQARTTRLEMMSDEYAMNQPGDPGRAADVLLRLVDSAEDAPLRLIMGGGALDLARSRYGDRLAEWTEWEVLSQDTDFPASS
jgi:NAD(P)-dependent dehydrogenase (short-subunit alcohol dehydrogenase family)